ncbi:MAG: hypothetical protein JOZ31_13255 [Verrucomicrobia bacterium]|nr:hypothetical protein [Verrucomicrobiota bacterium]
MRKILQAIEPNMTETRFHYAQEYFSITRFTSRLFHAELAMGPSLLDRVDLPDYQTFS